MKSPKKILVAKGYENIVAPGHPKVTDKDYSWAVVIKDVYPKKRIALERSLGFTVPQKPGSVEYRFMFSRSLKNAKHRLEVFKGKEYSKKNTKEEHEKLREARNNRWTTGEIVELVESENTDSFIPELTPRKRKPKWYESADGRKIRLFSQDDLTTPSQHEVNTLILEQASDIAEKLTELECQKAEIPCWTGDEQNKSFTDEAQSIFEVHYDQAVTSLYDLLNAQIKVLSEHKKQK